MDDYTLKALFLASPWIICSVALIIVRFAWPLAFWKIVLCLYMFFNIGLLISMGVVGGFGAPEFVTIVIMWLLPSLFFAWRICYWEDKKKNSGEIDS